MEKNNDDAKRVMFHRANKWDAARDILLTESRQWVLQHHERQKGTYTCLKGNLIIGKLKSVQKEEQPH